jgi:hypothetical protein
VEVFVVVLTHHRVGVDGQAELLKQKVDVRVESILATFGEQNHQRSAAVHEIFHAFQFDFVELLLWTGENEQADGLQGISGDFAFITAEKETKKNSFSIATSFDFLRFRFVVCFELPVDGFEVISELEQLVLR